MSDILEYFECIHCGAKFPNEPTVLRHFCPKKAESQTTAVQQIKAKVAALEKRLSAVNGADMRDIKDIVNICKEMQRLSAESQTLYKINPAFEL